MKVFIFAAIQFIIANVLFCQTDDMSEYKYIYRIKLDNYSTSCVIENTHDIFIDDNSKHKITFICKQINGEIDDFMYLSIIQGNDTIRIESNDMGIAECYLKNDYFILIVSSVLSGKTKFNIYTEPDEIINKIIIYSGKDYSLLIPLVYSKRQLSPNELFIIKEDIRNNTKKSKLLKNKTCVLLYEM